MSIISTVSELIGRGDTEKPSDCLIETLIRGTTQGTGNMLVFQYYPQTISGEMSSRVEETDIPGQGQLLQWTGYNNRPFSFDAIFTDNMKVSVDDKNSNILANGVSSAFANLVNVAASPVTSIARSVTDRVTGTNPDDRGTVEERNNRKSYPLDAVRAYLESLHLPQPIEGGGIEDPPLVKFILPNSGIVGTTSVLGNINEEIIARVMSTNFSHEKFYPNGKMRSMTCTITLKEQHNTGSPNWKFHSRDVFEQKGQINRGRRS